jgi:Zn finger protein HypA/HybF involved in hydrogenase expression
MKFIKLCSFLLLAFFCYNIHAEENKYIFVGQNGSDSSAKTAFVLEITDENIDNVFLMNEAGEIYLKADKVVAVPKNLLMNFELASNTSLVESATHALENGNESWKCPVCKAWNGPHNYECRICKTRR